MSFLSLALLPLPVVAMASDVGTPDLEILKGLYDKVRLGAEIPKDAELILQERAYTSPIWYTP